MSTNATITVQDADNSTLMQIYLHWDGHIDTAGKCLLKNYNSFAKALELVSLGDLSQLGEIIGGTTDFNSPHTGQCVAYGRDRQESGTEANVFRNFDELERDGMIEEYNYVFFDGAWHVQEHQINLYKLEELAKHPEVA